MTTPHLPDRIFHLALAEHWAACTAAGGPYTWSTADATLDEEGFIHASCPHQLAGVAERYYRGRDVVLLVIDVHAVPVIVRMDPVGDDAYPHIYGPLPLEAVVAALEVERIGDDHDIAAALAAL